MSQQLHNLEYSFITPIIYSCLSPTINAYFKFASYFDQTWFSSYHLLPGLISIVRYIRMLPTCDTKPHNSTLSHYDDNKPVLDLLVIMSSIIGVDNRAITTYYKSLVWSNAIPATFWGLVKMFLMVMGNLHVWDYYSDYV